jgi:hypothetical protein
MDPGQTLVFRPSRAKLLGWLVVGVAFAVIGVWMVSAGRWLGWIVIRSGAICSLTFGVQLLPNSNYLRVEPDGFTVCVRFHSQFCRWRDVGAFEVRRVAMSNMVVFNFAKDYRGAARLRKLNVALAGAEASVAISGAWSVRVDDLVDVLNRYRERYGAV